MTDALVVPLAAAAAVLVVTGAFKLARPAATAGAMGELGLPASLALARLLGGVELGTGVGVLAWPDTGLFPVPAVGAGALYSGFAVFVAVALRRNAMLQTCGCFGALEVPPTATHLALNIAGAAVCAGAAIVGSPSLTSVVRAAPADGTVLVLIAVIATGLAVASLTVLPLATTAPRRTSP